MAALIDCLSRIQRSKLGTESDRMAVVDAVKSHVKEASKAGDTRSLAELHMEGAQKFLQENLDRRKFIAEQAGVKIPEPPPITPPETRGISQAKTEAELGPGSVEPGVGAEIGAGMNDARKYINEGGDPRLPIRRAMKPGGKVGTGDINIVHAELERLRGERDAAARALEKDPNNPILQDDFAAADNEQRAWRKELQPVLTAAGNTLREIQAGSAPSTDLGTYQGLADLMDEHFKGTREVTPEMRTALTKAAKGVKEARDMANSEMGKVEETLNKKLKGKKVMTPEELDADLRGVLETAFKDCVIGV